MPTMPTGLDWAAVVTAVSSFLGETLVIGGLTAVLALKFVPKLIKVVRGVVR